MTVHNARSIGAQHPRVRDLLTLRKDGSPGRIMVEGTWEHDRLLTTTATIETFFWCPEAGATDVDRIAGRATEVYRISEKLLTRLSRKTRSDGLISIARLPQWRPQTFRFTSRSLVLVADGVEYAGNLGTLIRTADAANADCLVLTSRRARPTHPSVYSASRGTVLSTPILEFDDIPSAAAVAHEATSLGDPSTCTRQIRQLPTTGNFGYQHSVGTSIAIARAASRMVDPSGTVMERPSIVSVGMTRTRRGGQAIFWSI